MSASVRIACPMCGQPLDRESVEVIHIEFSTLNICGRCGFGLDLRWRGRGSALARSTPDWAIVAPLSKDREMIQAQIPPQVRVEWLEDPMDALGVCARSLRGDTPISLLIITTLGQSERWSDTAIAIRSLEEGFNIQRPLPIWHISDHQLTTDEERYFGDLNAIYWRSCEPNGEPRALIELLPELWS